MNFVISYFSAPKQKLPDFEQQKKDLDHLLRNALATGDLIKLFRYLRQFAHNDPTPDQIGQVFHLIADYLVKNEYYYPLKKKVNSVAILLYLGYRFPSELEKQLVEILKIFLTFTKRNDIDLNKVTPNQALHVIQYTEGTIPMRNWIFRIFDQVQSELLSTQEG